MNYEAFRHFADSWGLLFLMLIFLFAIWMALRPSARAGQERAKMIPFTDED